MKPTTFDLATNGITLGGHSWLPEAEPRAVLVISHGMAEHTERYAPLAADLVKAGFAVYGADHRGHKRTAGTLDKAGHIASRDSWRLVREDLAAVVKHVRYLHPGLPVVLLGHSFGSLLARDLVTTHPGLVDLLVLSGVVGDPGVIGGVGRLIARGQRRVLGGSRPSRLLDRLTFGSYNSAFKPVRTEFDWLTRDEAVVDAYVADPWCGFVCSNSFFDAMIAATRRVNSIELAARTPRSLPVLVIGGSHDPVGRAGRAPEQIGELYREIGLDDVTVKVYDEARHEVFNETNRDEVVADLLAWLEPRLSREAR
ncbi:alpha/beta hydrolase [Aestuariimicrobium ganziense]|uniref:alpha/beta hydrolase n=1 Tax=Aestuariimicrobium ganziense TaxID=2773677 RepID=UPI001942006B|nr:alpha/beta hydrolase [Aestuariimicrobium ganziense]